MKMPSIVDDSMAKQLPKELKGGKGKQMARKRKSKNDPASREEKERTTSDDEEEDLYGAPEEQGQSKKTTSTKTPRKTKSTTAVTPKSSSSRKKKTQAPAPSSAPSEDEEDDVEEEDSIEVEDNRRHSPRHSPRQSPTERRRSASASQQIADLESRNRHETMARSQSEKRLLEEKKQMMKELAQVKLEREEMEKELSATQKHQKDLRKRYSSALAKVGGRKCSALAKSKNEGMVTQVKLTTKRIVWRKVKFIGNDKVLQKVSKMVLDEMNIKDYLHYEDETEARKAEIDTRVEEWLALYSTDVRAAMNDQRSYVQSEMKKLALGWLKNGNELPPFEVFHDIAMRNVFDEDENEDPAKVKIFDLYMTMVSSCAGSLTYGDKKRRTEPVSQALESSGKAAVPPSTEAFCLVMYDNCYEKWLAMHDYREVQKKTGDFPKYSSKKHEETKQWAGKYSDSCSGNSPYGGWGSAGIKQYNKLRDDIKKLRASEDPNILEVEKDAMKRFCDLFQAERKRKRTANGYGEEEPAAPAKKTREEEEEVVAEIDSDSD